ncbi:alpha/beta fold hydrolase [Clostridium sp. YIM B02505]|uniref:Alpha/beta fold hydrolase n=1 Tax=Clostridium yunnanense TaxID=2800325 RepID=A0ABS1EW34_9CLOT|nr:alpha/beta hydrolase [Clostridium yunnanense]MBK1813597.1 alpha/beta fold hydrolase [Clostridium yunnanense]
MKELDLEYKIIGKGKTVLIIETGIGSSFYDWFSIVQKLKEDFTIVLYHRCGYGNSQVPITSRTTKNIAEELNCLLDKIEIKEKFILIGHSFGGLCVQHYAKLYPHRLKGIMLIDSTSFNFKQLYNLDTPVMNSLIALDSMIESNINSSKKSKEELKQQNSNIISAYENRLSDTDMKSVEEFFSNSTLHKTIADEFQNWDKDSDEIKSVTEFPNIPLIVISRDSKVAERGWVKYGIPEGEAILYENEWRKLQSELSKLSNQGRLIIAGNSDHEIYIDRPDIVNHYLKTLL